MKYAIVEDEQIAMHHLEQMISKRRRLSSQTF